MPEFRRGASAIAQAAVDAKNKQKGSFTPFAPKIFWKDDGDEKYLLFVNPLDEIPQAETIGFIPVARKKADGTKYTAYESVIARTDPAIGETEDAMVEEWDAKPKETNFAVAIELEPEFEEVNGRKKPIGFKVKTREFERKVRDDDGEVTDDLETVIAPQVGFVEGSPHTLFQSINAYDANDFPIEAYAVRIRKNGSGTTQSFSVTGFEDVDVNLEELLEIDGITYLDEDERDEIFKLAPDEDSTDEEFEQGMREYALAIGSAMLDKRLDELSDRDRYDGLLKGITASLDKFGAGKKSGSKKASSTRAPRATRSGARRSRTTTEEAPREPEATPEPEATEEKPPRRTRAPRKATPKAEAAPEETQAPDEAPETESEAPKTRTARAPNERLAALKAKHAKK